MMPPAIKSRPALSIGDKLVDPKKWIKGQATTDFSGYGAENPHEIVSGWVPKFVDHT